MNNPTPKEFLHGKRACVAGTEFAMRYETMADVWDACCESGSLSWLTWILSSEPALVADARRFGCWCVRNTSLEDGRTVWDLLTDPRSRASVAVAERYIAGEASESELRDAADAASAAYADADAADAASAYAAYAAVASAYADAPSAAADASHAVAHAVSCATAAAATYATAAAYVSAKVAASLAQIVHLRANNPFTSTESTT